jgi:predicted O-methyltransferase YrrM
METALQEGRGSVLEVGVADGHTTVYLNRWLDDIGANPRYYAIDTFAGFTDDDLTAEMGRGNSFVPSLRHDFRRSTKEAFSARMEANGVTRVAAVEGDAALVDYSPYSPIAFALIDVDVYRPVNAALQAIYPLISPGGTIVVDDCQPPPFSGRFVGASAAYQEFCEHRKIEPEVVLEMLGVLRKS